MMKKVLLYTLIISFTLGAFSPLHTFAQNEPTGICYHFSEGKVVASQSTQAQCDAVSTQHQWLSDTQVRSGVTPSIGGDTGSFQNSPNSGESCSFFNPLSCVGGALVSMANKIIPPFFSVIFWIIEQLMSLWMGIGGILLNSVIKMTIIDMSSRISTMDGINIAWKTIKDVTNIVFIFLLLYEAILIILSISSVGEVRKLITNIVIAALLVNFSLFFTKVLIDASNVVTVGVYEATISAAANGNNTDPLKSTRFGLSGAITNVMGLQSWEANKLNMTDVTGDYGPLVIHLMTSILYFVTGFIFLAVSVMFVIRYIVIIVLLALSPLAYLGTALPQLKDSSKMWWDSLRGQLLFPPAFMLMMWVALIIMSDKNFLLPTSLSNTGSITTGNVSAAIDIIFNFAIVIGMVMVAMITSKSLATKGSKYIGKMVNGSSKFVGNRVLGGAGAFGRNTFGRFGNTMTNSDYLKEKASQGGIMGFASRQALKSGDYAAKSTFDVRNSSAYKSASSMADFDFGKGADAKKVNFQKDLEAKAKKYEDMAKLMKPDDDKLKEQKGYDKVKSEMEAKKAISDTASKKIEELKKQKVEQQKKIDNAQSLEEAQRFGEELSDIDKNIKSNNQKIEDYKKAKSDFDTLDKEIKGTYKARVDRYADSVEKTGRMWRWSSGIVSNTANAVNISASGNTKGDNKVIAKKIRGVLKGKSAKDKLAEAYKDLQKEDPSFSPPEETPPAAEGGGEKKEGEGGGENKA